MRRISWKRGMRLSDSLFRASDDRTDEMVGHAFVLAANRRYGLLPSASPFELSLNIGKGMLGVEALQCLAITKDGHLIDAHFGSHYDSSLSFNVAIPEIPGIEEYYVAVSTETSQWKDVDDDYEEPVYTILLIGAENEVPDNAVPIAHIVDDGYGWHLDDINFVPPCIFVSAHPKFQELLMQFADVLSTLDEKARTLAMTHSHDMASVFWPMVQQLRIAADKECDLLTPMMLLSWVQKCVSAFTCACDLDDDIDLSDAKMYYNYVLAPYNYREAYVRIKVGLQFCASFIEKIDLLAMSTPSYTPKETMSHNIVVRPAAPALADNSLSVTCSTPETTLNVLCKNRSATVYFTTDGTQPTKNSGQASRAKDGLKIKFDNGYRKEKGKEPKKTIKVKLMAVEDGVESDTSTYSVALQKDLKFRGAIEV